MSRTIRCFGMLVLLFGLLVGGCSNRFDDGVPTTITPPFLQVKVGDTATISVFLSQPRKNAGTLTFNVGDATIIRPAEESSDVKIVEGQDVVHFAIQGIKAGETSIFATLDNARVQARVIVSDR